MLNNFPLEKFIHKWLPIINFVKKKKHTINQTPPAKLDMIHIAHQKNEHM
jgi:hypothetical protein